VFQATLNAIFVASVYALVALGFGWHYRLAKFFDFSYAVIFVVAPYACWTLLQFTRSRTLLTFWVCSAAGIACAIVFASTLESFLFRPLRARSAGALTQLLISLGVYVIMQNVISLTAGDEMKTIWVAPAKEGRLIEVGRMAGRITNSQLATVLLAILVYVISIAIMYRSQVGLMLRAVADNADLARIHGVNVNRIQVFGQGLGSIMCGIGGLCYAVDMDMTPGAGLNILLKVAAALAIGGIGSLSGIMAGCFAVSLLENFTPFILENRWQDTIVFSCLLVLLLVRPAGLLGRSIR
jgi:branched-chain amino acid transport system permease protein